MVRVFVGGCRRQRGPLFAPIRRRGSGSTAGARRPESGPNFAGLVQQQPGDPDRMMIRIMVNAFTSLVSGQPTALRRMRWSMWCGSDKAAVR